MSYILQAILLAVTFLLAVDDASLRYERAETRSIVDDGLGVRNVAAGRVQMYIQGGQGGYAECQYRSADYKEQIANLKHQSPLKPGDMTKKGRFDDMADSYVLRLAQTHTVISDGEHEHLKDVICNVHDDKPFTYEEMKDTAIFPRLSPAR